LQPVFGGSICQPRGTDDVLPKNMQKPLSMPTAILLMIWKMKFKKGKKRSGILER
jgi:hypothetical protein